MAPPLGLVFCTPIHKSPPTIHSIPLEVLSEIFILALPTDQELYSRPQFYDNERRNLINPTLVLCAVCSSWRFLAFSIPRLWTRILIHIPHGINEAQAKRKAADLVQWILRSRSRPLTLHISGSFINFPDTSTRPEARIISVINNHAACWESLHSRDFNLSSPLFHTNGWHSLRRLHYYYSDPAPCANEIVPSGHLTHLQIQHYIPCRDATMIFMTCPKLVYLSIMVDTSKFEPSTVPTIMQDLATFYLKHCAAKPRTILHRLSLPSLQDISISEISSGDIESLINLFTRSSCTLDRLEICGVNLTSRDYLNILAHSSCDSLTSLSIRPLYLGYVPIDEEVLRRLTLHRHDTMCSHLSSLTIDYCISSYLFSAVLNMAKSRIGPAASQVPGEPTLQYLWLNLKCRTEENMAELDRVGRGSGMKYSRNEFRPCCFSVQLQKQGFTEPPNFSELFWS